MPYSIINIHAKIFIEPSLCGRYTGCFLRSALLSNIKCLFNQLLIISKSALLWRIILNIFTLLQFDRWNVYMSSILNISCRRYWCWKWFKTVFVITCGDTFDDTLHLISMNGNGIFLLEWRKDVVFLVLLISNISLDVGVWNKICWLGVGLA